ncbi:hypothetical protein O6H91_22G047800 [Diphasiastrum complanatum]|uniref:Uncharacterized protein n=1 Tax=Diphasiastrum complanatum TaxID=34168 RepID=A0ACC2AF95_DIPCM|nr:hypothetical protein O6H91_22G047800 [Diphasiastrum complanatum]
MTGCKLKCHSFGIVTLCRSNSSCRKTKHACILHRPPSSSGCSAGAMANGIDYNLPSVNCSSHMNRFLIKPRFGKRFEHGLPKKPLVSPENSIISRIIHFSGSLTERPCLSRRCHLMGAWRSFSNFSFPGVAPKRPRISHFFLYVDGHHQ